MAEQPVLGEVAPRVAGVAAVRLEQLHKVYRGPPEVHAVAGIDLTVAEGEMFGLLGPNGAGKSTTVGICTTRIRPTAGRVLLAGMDVASSPAQVKRRIGVVTQDNTLDRSLTLRETLFHHCRYFGWSRRRSHARADELLEQFRLTERSRAFPDQISGGMAQRLQVARAVAHEPAVLFLDEPTAGLDPQSRLALWELIEQRRAAGLTVVLTTHYIQEADQLCDRVAIIDHGRILVCDTPENLKATYSAGAVVQLTLQRPPTARLLTVLGALDGVQTVEATTNGVRLLADQRSGLLPRVVSATDGEGLRDVSVSGATLEAVFVELTGRELRE